MDEASGEVKGPQWHPENPNVVVSNPQWYDETGQTIVVYLMNRQAYTNGKFKPNVVVFTPEEVDEILLLPSDRFEDGSFQRKLLTLKQKFGGSFLGEFLSREQRAERTERAPCGRHPFLPPSSEQASGKDEPSSPSPSRSGSSSSPSLDDPSSPPPPSSTEETGGSGGSSFGDWLASE